VRTIIISLVLIFCFLTPLAFAEALEIKEIDTTHMRLIKIIGKGFGTKTGQSAVKFTYKVNDKELGSVDVDIEEWNEEEITVKAPDISKQSSAEVEIEITTPDCEKVTGKFLIYRDIVSEAIKLKAEIVSENTIKEHLARQAEETAYRTLSNKNVFGNIQLSAFEVNALLKAKLSDDFIGEMEGFPQFVTVGVAGIWLFKTAEVAAAPMLRIFIFPRSYYMPRTRLGAITKEPSRFFNVIFDRFDINVGYTTSTQTRKEETKKQEKTNYVLVGLSFELSRAALFNFGLALVPEDVKGTRRQLYLGVTVDYNLLKDIGIVKK